MKALTACLLLFLACAAQADELAARLAAVPNPKSVTSNGFVADPAGTISARTADINALLSAFERDTGVEVAVVVLPSIGGLVPKEFAVALLKKWGVGKAGQDNGVLVLQVLDQRRIEIEVGYGLEGILPDVKCSWITENVAKPYFKQNNMADGHFEVVRALRAAIQQPDITREQLLAQVGKQSTAAPLGLAATSPPQQSYESVDPYAANDEPAARSPGGLKGLLLLLLGLAIYATVGRVFRIKSANQTAYERYQLFASGTTRWQYFAMLPVAAAALAWEYSLSGTFVSPLFAGAAAWLAIWRRRVSVLRGLRLAPRTCQCGQQMRKLDEQQDDAHLPAGNVSEEQVGSMDYDVWLCSCGRKSVESYQGHSRARACPACHYRTLEVTSTVTLEHATRMSEGRREITEQCAHCQHVARRIQTIPRIQEHSHSHSRGSRSSGSGRSSGGSWGGGRSGGGGAGSSY